MNAKRPYRLITIPFSHYCEKVRWALDWLSFPYLEEGHLPLFHYWHTFKHGAGRTVPVLITDEGVLGDSTRILHYLDQRVVGARRLYPSDPLLLQEVMSLEELFDAHFGPMTRLWMYYHVLPEGPRLLKYTADAPLWEQLAALFLFPVMATWLTSMLDISEKRAELARERFRMVTDEVSERLADGRHYLVGDELSAADITFASMAAPLLIPERYGAPLPPIEGLPLPMQDEIHRFRSTPAGAYAIRLYRDERRPVGH